MFELFSAPESLPILKPSSTCLFSIMSVCLGQVYMWIFIDLSQPWASHSVCLTCVRPHRRGPGSWQCSATHLVIFSSSRLRLPDSCLDFICWSCMWKLYCWARTESPLSLISFPSELNYHVWLLQMCLDSYSSAKHDKKGLESWGSNCGNSLKSSYYIIIIRSSSSSSINIINIIHIILFKLSPCQRKVHEHFFVYFCNIFNILSIELRSHVVT